MFKRRNLDNVPAVSRNHPGLTALLIAAPSIATAEQAHVEEGAASLPNRMMQLMPQLHAAISLVARTHIGCANIDNASFSETYGTEKSPAFFVSCTMKNKPFEFQKVFVKDGRIIGTKP